MRQEYGSDLNLDRFPLPPDEDDEEITDGEQLLIDDALLFIAVPAFNGVKDRGTRAIIMPNMELDEAMIHGIDDLLEEAIQFELKNPDGSPKHKDDSTMAESIRTHFTRDLMRKWYDITIMPCRGSFQKDSPMYIPNDGRDDRCDWCQENNIENCRHIGM